MEITFRAQKMGSFCYLKVGSSLSDERIKEAILKPFDAVKDHCERIVLTMDNSSSDLNGIKVLNLIEWLLDEKLFFFAFLF